MENKGLLASQYRDEDAARAHIESIRWPDGPVCPKCGLVNEAYKLEPKKVSKHPVRKGVWKCKACRKQFTVTVDSIFEDSHIPLHKWLLAIHLLTSAKKGFSAHQLMRNLDLKSYRSAWFMAHRIRWALTQEPMKTLLGGPLEIVEVDETYIGPKEKRKPGMPGKTSKKTPVVALLEREGNVRSFQLESISAPRLKPILQEYIDPRSKLITDESSIYIKHGKRFAEHHSVAHCRDEYVRMEGKTKVTTNTVESYFSLLKRGNYGVYHHWSRKYLKQYLREFDWRYNVRKLPDMERAAVALRMTSGKRLMLNAPQSVEKN
jgi:transposase-like protein